MVTKAYEQLLDDLRQEYRPQREWGAGKGVLMVVGHFLVGVAGGTWVVASYNGLFAGMVVATLLAVAGAIVHLLFLGKPSRAFNMVRHVSNSWISRGFVGLSLFLLGSFGVLLLQVLGEGAALQVLANCLQVIAGIGAGVIIGYMGFCYTASKAVPFWHSPTHPIIYVAFAFRGGIAAILILSAFSPVSLPYLLEWWLGLTALICVLFGLEIHSALFGGNLAARRSAREILAGRLALIFYGGTLLIGLVVPVFIIVVGGSGSAVPMALVGLTSVAGDFFMKLSIVRAGVYMPIVPNSP